MRSKPVGGINTETMRSFQAKCLENHLSLLLLFLRFFLLLGVHQDSTAQRARLCRSTCLGMRTILVWVLRPRTASRTYMNLTLFHTQSFHTPVSNGPWLKNHVMSMTSPSTPLKVFEGWEADCVKPEAVALPTCSIWFASRLLQCPVLDCLSFYSEITLCDALLNYETIFCFGLYCHDSLELQVMNGARLRWAWWLHIS